MFIDSFLVTTMINTEKWLNRRSSLASTLIGFISQKPFYARQNLINSQFHFVCRFVPPSFGRCSIRPIKRPARREVTFRVPFLRPDINFWHFGKKRLNDDNDIDPMPWTFITLLSLAVSSRPKRKNDKKALKQVPIWEVVCVPRWLQFDFVFDDTRKTYYALYRRN